MLKSLLGERLDKNVFGKSKAKTVFVLSKSRSDFSSQTQQKILNPMFRSRRDRIANGTPFVTSSFSTNAS